MGEYELGRVLGYGRFGIVHEGEHLSTKKKVAVKIVPKKNQDYSLEREVANQSRLDHEHVVKILDVISLKGSVYIVMEFIEGGDLFEYIISHVRVSEEECKRIFWQLLQAVEHCHARDVVHRDIKPENILLDTNNNVKLADFGLSTLWKRDEFLTDSCGSPEYAAPELLNKNCKYEGPKVDIWSCGVVLYALLCNALPFGADDFQSLFRLIQAGQYSIPGFVSPAARDLIQHVIEVEPRRRFTLDQVKKHPWLGSEAAADRPAILKEIACIDQRVQSVEMCSQASILKAVPTPVVVSTYPAGDSFKQASPLKHVNLAALSCAPLLVFCRISNLFIAAAVRYILCVLIRRPNSKWMQVVLSFAISRWQRDSCIDRVYQNQLWSVGFAATRCMF